MNVAHNDRNYEVSFSGNVVREVRVVTERRYIRHGGDLGDYITKRIDIDSKVAKAVIIKAYGQMSAAA